MKVPVVVGASFATLFLGAFLAAIGLYVLSRRRSHKSEKLLEAPVSRWNEKRSDLTQDVAERPQVYPFRVSQVGFEESRHQVLTNKLQIPEPSRLRHVGTGVVERPPSYPQEYSPSDSDYLSRTTGVGPSLSPQSSTSRNGFSEKSLSPLGRGERHYDPLGPLRMNRSRRIENIG